ncbi:hypothetical protein [Streptomyces spectabilis]|uniref:Uncharacterized protein n=1 Tax=Streptomyces spectabilis TaxID=68270 RepID=A0A516RF87_STRST|nr:hypothetical protein [Streptomyces spectabilis]QDQ14319.1 hypothetical protein FH965_30210 [Streptomyces spectabilis]
MAAYRVFLYNLRTQRVTGEVPFSALSYSYVMDEPGAATVEIPIDVAAKSGKPLKPNDLFPVRTGLVIERDGELVWGGVVWTYRLNLTTRTIALNAKGYLSYYEKRHTPTYGLGFADRELTYMIRALILIAKEGIGTDTTQLTPTNQVRSRVWNPFEFKPVADVFRDLSDEIASIDHRTGLFGGGFFLYFEPYWKNSDRSLIGNRIRNTPNRHPYDSGVSLHQGVNCEFSDISVDGTELASAAFAVGATNGMRSLTPFKSDTNPALLATTPQTNKVLTENSLKQNWTLTYKVRSALAFGSEPIVLPNATTYPGKFSPLSLIPGMRAGVTTDDGFLGLVNDEYVVTENRVSVASDGSDRLSLSLVQAELFKETELG